MTVKEKRSNLEKWNLARTMSYNKRIICLILEVIALIAKTEKA